MERYWVYENSGGHIVSKGDDISLSINPPLFAWDYQERRWIGKNGVINKETFIVAIMPDNCPIGTVVFNPTDNHFYTMVP